MKVIAFNSSPRKDGNTNRLIQQSLKALQEEGIQTELIQIGGQTLHGCTACGTCRTLKNKQCSITTDDVNSYIQKMIEADGILLGSPTYFSMMTPELKALIDRAGYVAMSNGGMFKRKVGAAVVAVRRAGAMPTFDAINHFFLISGMVVPGSNYWNIGVGRAVGEVENDEEGMRTMTNLGKNMAWLLKKINPP
ncbi:MAG: flavodoxin family protein [Candidatus Bathyarchaeota archaeon]|nr:flavodoxin family protein [Candidatus Bathyarchaeota archaeon]